MFFGMSGVELFLILIFAFMIFGPDKLPALAKTAGKALAKFRSAQDEMNNVLKKEVFDPTAEEPFKNPLDAADRAAQRAKEEKAKAEEKIESFAERKARYDRERAAKKAADAEIARAAATGDVQAVTAAVAAGAGAVARASADAAVSAEAKAGAAGGAADAAKPAVSAAELYGTKPVVKKPAEPAARKTEPAAKPTVATDDVRNAVVDASDEKGE